MNPILQDLLVMVLMHLGILISLSSSQMKDLARNGSAAHFNLHFGPTDLVFTPGEQDKCFFYGQIGHLAPNCERKMRGSNGNSMRKVMTRLCLQSLIKSVTATIRVEHKDDDF